MKKKTKPSKKGSKSLLSGATEDAEAGGLPEGRVRFSDTHTQIVSKANYDGGTVKASADDAVPVLSSTCTPVDKKNKPIKGNKPFNIHLSGGSIDRIVPDAKKGIGFVPAPDSKARGLSRSCNAQLFLNSLEDAGVPPKLLKAGDYTFMDGMIVELVRLPQPKRRNLGADDEDSDSGGYEKTYPAVSEIYEADFDVKAKKKGKKAKDEDEDEDTEDEDDSDDSDDEDDDDEEEEESDDDDEDEDSDDDDSDEDEDEEEEDDDEDSDEDDSEDDDEGDDDTEKLAIKFAKKALADPKAKKKGIAADDFYTAVFPLVKSHKERKAIMKHIKDEKWARSSKRPWTFDKKTERFSLS